MLSELTGVARFGVMEGLRAADGAAVDRAVRGGRSRTARSCDRMAQVSQRAQALATTHWCEVMALVTTEPSVK